MLDYCEVRILVGNDVPTQRATIKTLWHHFLKDDSHFHYLHEPGYLLVRFKREMFWDYLPYLDELGIEYQFGDEWIEQSQAVREYPEFYAAYFHLISVFILSNDITLSADEGLGTHVLDRISHCFYNISGMHSQREDAVMAVLALGRARNAGYAMGARDA